MNELLQRDQIRMIKAYAVHAPGEPFTSFEYDPGDLGPEEVEIAVEYCGLCHSDLSMVDNEWGGSQYPLVPGHEVVGTLAALGSQVSGLKLGQRVGLGWFAQSCMSCEWCLSGDHNLCRQAQGTIVGRYGGFADRVRAHAAWAVPLPEGVPPETAGPLFCGGITVFNPIVQLNIQPTDRVGVIGIGGLGHMALRFLSAWGCKVTAFTSSPDKEAEARQMGAAQVVNSRDSKALAEIAGSLDVIISTVNVGLDWAAYLGALRPRGRLHLVGVITTPLELQVFSLMSHQKSISASPLGSPAMTAKMLEFAARHGIEPITETYNFDQVNEAIDRLRNGKPRYRIVLKR